MIVNDDSNNDGDNDNYLRHV